MGGVCSALDRSSSNRNLCQKETLCGHTCSFPENHKYGCKCNARCDYLADCGHQCRQKCSTRHNHDRPCDHRCTLRCLHGKQCKKRCGEPCRPCKAACPIKCEHSTCDKKCGDYDSCRMPQGCKMPCKKHCEKCGKRCVGLCGHKCPPCTKCQPFTCPISLEEFNDEAGLSTVYALADCECSFEITSLDRYVDTAMQTATGRTRYIKCPSCSALIQSSWRYSIYIRRLLTQSSHLETSSPTSPPSLAEVAIISEALIKSDPGAHRMRNHWYQCSKGHPFYVGECGMPTETGWCVECKQRVGMERGRMISKPYLMPISNW